MSRKDFGLRVRSLRTKRNETQSALGLRLGLTDKAISACENGRHYFTYTTMLNLCNHWEISITELLQVGGEDKHRVKEKGSEINRALNTIQSEVLALLD